MIIAPHQSQQPNLNKGENKERAPHGCNDSAAYAAPMAERQDDVPGEEEDGRTPETQASRTVQVLPLRGN
jgi:hypothetical protein